MSFKQLSVLLIILLVSPVFVSSIVTTKAQVSSAPQGLYLGVDAAFADVAQTEQLIDNVSTYTNFFVIGCEQKIGQNGGLGVYNETRLTVISQYAYSRGLNFIVYSDDPFYPSKQWLANATENYGTHFMGIYYFDEPGGKQLDSTELREVTSAANFTDAANQYVKIFNYYLHNSTFAITNSFPTPNQYKLYTSDYGLYWYDYQGGYDTVFAELGLNSGNMNYSRQLSMAFCRGAATAFQRDWGVIITYGQTSYPYIENSDQLKIDMQWAYEDGAKYIIVFDSNPSFTESILSSQQLDAIKEMWQYAQSHPRASNQPADRSAFVLPEDFGYSFRSPNDTVWGLWNANWSGSSSLAFVADISMSVVTFLQMWGAELDVIYPVINGTVMSLGYLASLGYQHVIYWNDTSIVPNMPSMPPASPAVSPNYFPGLNDNPFHVGASSPHGAGTLDIYLAVTAVIVAACIVAVTFVSRRRKSSSDESKLLA